MLIHENSSSKNKLPASCCLEVFPGGCMCVSLCALFMPVPSCFHVTCQSSAVCALAEILLVMPSIGKLFLSCLAGYMMVLYSY